MADYSSEELFMDMLLHNFPKTRHPYDTITMAMILAPSFASVICSEKVHMPTLLSDLVTLVLVAWVVRFFSNWPERWVRHLKQVRTSLLNFVNLVKIEIGQTFFLPEMALNRRIFVSNLVVAQRLIRLEQFAWLGGIGGTVAGAALMWITRNYLISSDIYNSQVFSNPTILLYVVWSFFKLALQYLDSLKASITFAKTTTSESCVTENNLSYYIDMFCLESPVELPTMSPKQQKEELSKVESPFTPKKLNMKAKTAANRTPSKPATKPKRSSRLVMIPETQAMKPKSCFSDAKKVPKLEKPKSVSFTPFPLTGTSFRRKDDSQGTLSPIVEDQEQTQESIVEEPVKRSLKEELMVAKAKTEPLNKTLEQPFEEPALKKNPGRVSVIGITIPESNPSLTRQQFRELHLKDMSTPLPLTPSLPVLPLKVFRSHDSDEALSRMERITDSHKQRVQDDWSEVRSKLTNLKESCYESAWHYAETARQMDMLELFSVWFLANVFVLTPLWLTFRMVFMLFRLPIMATQLYISLTLFIPIVIFKITIVAPARLLVKFMSDSNYKNISFYDYRMSHSLPLLRDRVTLKLLRKFLKLLQVEIEDSARSNPSPVEVL